MLGSRKAVEHVLPFIRQQSAFVDVSLNNCLQVKYSFAKGSPHPNRSDEVKHSFDNSYLFGSIEQELSVCWRDGWAAGNTY